MRRFQPDENVNMVNVSFNADYFAAQLIRYLRDKFLRPVAYLTGENGTPILGTPYQVIRECVLRVTAALCFQTHACNTKFGGKLLPL